MTERPPTEHHLSIVTEMADARARKATKAGRPGLGDSCSDRLALCYCCPAGMRTF